VHGDADEDEVGTSDSLHDSTVGLVVPGSEHVEGVDR
jgi:hypothetical protein